MIDLHLHTTASDGLCTPSELMARARLHGITALSVTDHDTAAALPEAAEAAAVLGLEFVPGIEITSVWHQTDVHVLGYFFDDRSAELAAFLDAARTERLERAREIVARLSALGVSVDFDKLMMGAHSARAIARPAIARALVDQGYVDSVSAAFERYLSAGRPAYVPHRGPSPERAVQIIRRARGIASLAHPGPLGHDELIPALVRVGLGAIEAYHSDHSPEMTARYLALAAEHGLAVTGGSDYHGDGIRRAEMFGVIGLGQEDFQRFLQAAGRPHPLSSLV